VPGTLRGDTAGLHVVLELPGGQVDEVVAAARRRGLVLHTLRRYFAGPPTAAGLVLGYGAVPEAQVAASATVLRDVLLGMCR
jgi:GntR family transcriptional regulator/MocR family aminotransferase